MFDHRRLRKQFLGLREQGFRDFAGQVCIAPDSVCVPHELCAAFVDQARVWVARAYPGIPENPDYTAMITERHAARMRELVAAGRWPQPGA